MLFDMNIQSGLQTTTGLGVNAEVSGYLEIFSKASMVMQSMHYFVVLGTTCVNYSKSSGFFTPNIGRGYNDFLFSLISKLLVR